MTGIEISWQTYHWNSYKARLYWRQPKKIRYARKPTKKLHLVFAVSYLQKSKIEILEQRDVDLLWWKKERIQRTISKRRGWWSKYYSVGMLSLNSSHRLLNGIMAEEYYIKNLKQHINYAEKKTGWEHRWTFQYKWPLVSEKLFADNNTNVLEQSYQSSDHSAIINLWRVLKTRIIARKLSSLSNLKF